MSINLKCSFCDKIIGLETASVVCMPCASKLVEPTPQADNTGSPKLPSFKEICNNLGGVYTEDSPEGKHLRVQSKYFYDCMVRQLRASA